MLAKGQLTPVPAHCHNNCIVPVPTTIVAIVRYNNIIIDGAGGLS